MLIGNNKLALIMAIKQLDLQVDDYFFKRRMFSPEDITLLNQIRRQLNGVRCLIEKKVIS